MVVIDVEGKIVSMEWEKLDKIRPEELKELDEAYEKVINSLVEKGGKLVIQPLKHGVRILRVKDGR